MSSDWYDMGWEARAETGRALGGQHLPRKSAQDEQKLRDQARLQAWREAHADTPQQIIAQTLIDARWCLDPPHWLALAHEILANLSREGYEVFQTK